MKIIKRDGRIEEFNVKKIITSIENAARDCNTLLNQSDLIMLSKEVEKLLVNIRKDSLITSSYEVIGVVFKILKKERFTQVLKSYMDFDK